MSKIISTKESVCTGLNSGTNIIGKLVIKFLRALDIKQIN
jgi:hypothetical protein